MPAAIFIPIGNEYVNDAANPTANIVDDGVVFRGWGKPHNYFSHNKKRKDEVGPNSEAGDVNWCHVLGLKIFLSVRIQANQTNKNCDGSRNRHKMRLQILERFNPILFFGCIRHYQSSLSA